MAETKDTQVERIAPEQWIRHPVSDHADLDRAAPVYAEDLDPNARAEFEASLGVRREQEAALAAEAEALAAKQAEKQRGGKAKKQS